LMVILNIENLPGDVTKRFMKITTELVQYASERSVKISQLYPKL